MEGPHIHHIFQFVMSGPLTHCHYMLFDLHVHTDISPCSELRLSEILDRARGLGLDGVCITDHDTMAARALVADGLQPDGLCIVVGMEYATPQGDFLLFGPFEDLKPGLTGREVLRLVQDRDGAAIGAHPFRPNRSVDETLVIEGLCPTLEALNGRNTPRANQDAFILGEQYGAHLTGGSDAHTLAELGRFATRFEMPVRGNSDLIAAIRAGVCRPEALRALSPNLLYEARLSSAL